MPDNLRDVSADTCDEPGPFHIARNDGGTAGGNGFRDGDCRMDNPSHRSDFPGGNHDTEPRLQLMDRLERQPGRRC